MNDASSIGAGSVGAITATHGTDQRSLILDAMSESTVKGYRRWRGLFDEWVASTQSGNVVYSEQLLVQWVQALSQKYAASSIWTAVSLVKKYLEEEKQVDIGCCKELNGTIGVLQRSHKAKQAAAFTRSELDRIWSLDESTLKVLLLKAIAAVAFFGGLRSSETSDLNRSDVSEVADGYKIVVRKSKTDRAQIGWSFVVPRGSGGTSTDANNCFNIFHRYLEATKEVGCERLFVTYRARNGAFINSPVGKNMVANVPKLLASMLELPNPEKYTGHALRATMATTLADSGVSMENLKRSGRWRSDAAMERYVRDSMVQKMDTATTLSGDKKLKRSDGANGDGAGAYVRIFTDCVFNSCTIATRMDSTSVNSQVVNGNGNSEAAVGVAGVDMAADGGDGADVEM